MVMAGHGALFRHRTLDSRKLLMREKLPNTGKCATQFGAWP